MIKSIFKASLVLGVLASTAAVADTGSFSVANERIDCLAGNGVRVKTIKPAKDGMNPIVRTTWGLAKKDMYAGFNPYFGLTTWITLGAGTGIVADGYQIFLMGNPAPGLKTTLVGSLGKVVSTPSVVPGMAFPVGFVAIAPIRCEVYWENRTKFD